MALGHPVCLGRAILDPVEVFDQEGLLPLEEVVLVLLIGQQDFVHGLRNGFEESGNALLVVLPSDAQLEANVDLLNVGT